MIEPVVIVRTGVANVASLVAAFDRLGVATRVSADPDDVACAARIVLPGVGTYRAAMERLTEAGLVDPLRERIAAGRATLAVCLGLQLFAAMSAENAGVPGLGVVETAVVPLPGDGPRPQLGWNEVTVVGTGLLESGAAYFANGYCLATAPDGWRTATASYGGTFVAAIERGAVLGCQFHPELSGVWGETLLARWLEMDPC